MAIKKLPSTGEAPRSSGVPSSLAAGGTADSAGLPWEGRSFDQRDTDFDSDFGETSEALLLGVDAIRDAAAKLAANESAESADARAQAAGQHRRQELIRQLGERHADMISLLTTERLLVPLLTEAGEVGETPDGRIVDKTQELSIVTVASPDGRRVLPVFSSVDTLRRWHPEARPIPVVGAKVALAAVQESTDLIIVDAATPEREFGVRRPALEFLARGERYLPGWADDEVAAEFGRVLADEAVVSAVGLTPADPESRLIAPDVEVTLETTARLDREELAELLQRVQSRLAESEIIAQRVDSLRLRPTLAESENEDEAERRP